MLAYCVKCKMTRELKNAQPLYNTRGTPYSKGVCGVCGTALTRLGASELHAGMQRPPTIASPKPKAESRKRKAESGKRKAERKSAIRIPHSAIGRLVIVESPAKARTIGRFLGSGYRVRASIGHIRDLPERQFGVDIEHDFRPHYVITPKKKETVAELRADANSAAEIFLATDPDREGEAISWHLVAALEAGIRGKPVHRVEFHEITRDAIDRAFANPRAINQQLVDAQQARRVLDRIVGYTISPLLRKKINTKNLSAGRVQSVAVRLVVEREREIQAFVPVEYWSIEAELAKRVGAGEQGRGGAGETRRHGDAETPASNLQSLTSKSFRAKLVKVGDKDFECHAGDDALKLKAVLEQCAYVVLDVRKKEVQRNPAAPFITSTLQQEASRKLGYNARRTMQIAQSLYEGVAVGEEGSVGLITYMRTDSTNVAESAGKEAWAYIKQKFGDDYLPRTPRIYKTKVASAQEAHEAIRPTSVFREPNAIKQSLDADQFKLYELIWKRFVASQMASAVLDTTAVDIGAWERGSAGAGETNHPITQSPNYLFRANGSVIKFIGFLIIYPEEVEPDRELPPLAKEEPLDLLGIYPEQHFTQPPPRYTEATLIKALEEHGIGRPSTYAPILSTIQERGYVERLPDRRLKPSDLGFIVNDLLVKHFPQEVDLKFTAQMEDKLDRVAEGQADWVETLREFYAPFKQTLDRAAEEMPSVQLPVETTDEKCDKCGAPMVVKRGRFGKFLACSAFPKCKNTRNLSASGGSVKTGVTCPECKQGEIEEKKSRKGKIFYSCNRYPDCKFALWDKPIPTPCPKCGGILTQNKKGVRCVNGDYVGEAVAENG